MHHVLPPALAPCWLASVIGSSSSATGNRLLLSVCIWKNKKKYTIKIQTFIRSGSVMWMPGMQTCTHGVLNRTEFSKTPEKLERTTEASYLSSTVGTSENCSCVSFCKREATTWMTCWHSRPSHTHTSASRLAHGFICAPSHELVMCWYSTIFCLTETESLKANISYIMLIRATAAEKEREGKGAREKGGREIAAEWVREDR